MILHRAAVIGISLLFPFIALAGSADDDSYKLIAKEIFESPDIAGRIAIYPIDHKAAKIPKSTALLIEDPLHAAIARSANDHGLAVIARSELTNIFNDRQFVGQSSDFEELAKKANVDVIISITARRQSPRTLVVTAKALGVSGSIIGRVLSSSHSYNIEIQPAANVVVEGVFSDGIHNSKYDSSLISGLTNKSGINSVSSAKEADFIIKSTVAAEISEKTTQEAQGAQLFGSFLGGAANMGGPQGGPPIGNIAQGFQKSLGQIGHFKVVAISVVTEAHVPGESGTVTSEKSATVDLPPNSTDDQLRQETQALVRKTLIESGNELSAKLLGEALDRSNPGGKKSLLD